MTVSNFPDSWKTNKNFQFWLSQQSSEIMAHPTDNYYHESLIGQFAQQYHAEEIQALKEKIVLLEFKIHVAKQRLSFPIKDCIASFEEIVKVTDEL